MIRKGLLGVSPLTHLVPEGYTDDVTGHVYETMTGRAATALAAGHSVIADAVKLGDNTCMSSDEAARRTLRMTVRRFASHAEADRHDLEFWMQLSQAERVLQVWRLSQEQWRLANLPDESGLCRSVASVQRR